jgi:DMSO/TMAO reductase YedYZ molybdopterin-dependent catalytic subunit
MTARRWILPALAGIAAVALGLGAAELAAALAAPTASPVLVIGSLLIDFAPSWAKEAAIALFGTGDKAALLVGIGLVLLVVSAAAGVLQWRRPPLGRILIAAGAVFGIAAAVTRSGAAVLDAVPSTVAAIVAVVALGFLLRKAPEIRTPELKAQESSAPASGTPAAGRPGDPTRRTFLGWTGGAAALGALAAAAGTLLQSGARAATAIRDAFTLPGAAVAAPPIPAGAELGIAGLAPVITPNAEFYRIDTALQIPRIDPNTWTLRITGEVENEVELTWAELIALPLEESVTTLMCVSNEVGGDLIGNAVWLGYPIRELLARAAPKSGADMVLSRSIDGFTAGTPLPVLQDDRNAILAIGMNGEPLPEEHGFPVRMVVPGLYGYVSATKWVVELQVTRFSATTAYWTDRGWGERGPIKIQSRIDVAKRDGDGLLAAGVAWHQHTGISRVEVQLDDEPWEEAELADAISIDTWVQWRYRANPDPGDHTLRVRATGADGATQTETVRDVLPDGATGYHTIDISL